MNQLSAMRRALGKANASSPPTAFRPPMAEAEEPGEIEPRGATASMEALEERREKKPKR